MFVQRAGEPHAEVWGAASHRLSGPIVNLSKDAVCIAGQVADNLLAVLLNLQQPVRGNCLRRHYPIIFSICMPVIIV